MNQKRSLQAGPLTAFLENSGLRTICWHGVEIVRGIYSAVRDENWGTVPAVLEDLSIEQNAERFRVSFHAVHIQGGIAFEWDGSIEGTSGGALAFTMKGSALSSFYKNRIGFCVLHSMELAGTPLRIVTEDGIMAGEFPQRISPHQPFMGISSLVSEPEPGVNVEMKLEGDVFEMEDQRNWTDASYKTYCTPLSRPFPVFIQKGEEVAQSVTLQVMGIPESPRSSAASNVSPLYIAEPSKGYPLPAIGLGYSDLGRRLNAGELSAIQALSLTYLHVELDMNASGWERVLERAEADCRELQIWLELEVICKERADCLDKLMAIIKDRCPSVTDLQLFDSASHVSSQSVLKHAKQLKEQLGLDELRIGGGTRANFAEFNRANLPTVWMDSACYSISPQVHAFDSESLMETLAAQTVTVESAKALADGLPVRVGPVTMKQRFNPVATSGASISPAERADSRQQQPFGASWLLGSIIALRNGGADAVSYFETTGLLGVMEVGGEAVWPLYHILQAVGEFKQAEVLDTTGGSPLIAALAMRQGDGKVRIFLVNKHFEPQEMSIRLREPVKEAVTVIGNSDSMSGIVNQNGYGEIVVTLSSYEAVVIDCGAASSRSMEI